MNPDQLKNIRVALLSGEEFQRLELFKEIVDCAADAATRDFNLDMFNAENFNLAAFSAQLVTFPMMAERRVVTVRNFDKIHKETRKKACAAIKETPDTTLVVIEGEKATLTPKPPANFLLKESFKIIYENRLPSWIQGRFSKRGKTVEQKAIALLINNMGMALRELDNEIEKVTVAAHDKKHVSEEDVASVVGAFKRDTVWNLCNAVGLGDFSDAADILTRLMEAEKNKETFYIGSIASHIMKLAEYNRLMRAGTAQPEAMKVATSSPFLWKLNKMDIQAKNFGPREVRRALTILARAESTLKKQSIDKRLMMEILLPLITAKRKSGRRA